MHYQCPLSLPATSHWFWDATLFFFSQQCGFASIFVSRCSRHLSLVCSKHNAIFWYYNCSLYIYFSRSFACLSKKINTCSFSVLHFHWQLRVKRKLGAIEYIILHIKFFCLLAVAYQCPPGHACPLGSAEPMPCPSGSYQPAPRQSSCRPCPPGDSRAVISATKLELNISE